MWGRAMWVRDAGFARGLGARMPSAERAAAHLVEPEDGAATVDEAKLVGPRAEGLPLGLQRVVPGVTQEDVHLAELEPLRPGAQVGVALRLAGKVGVREVVEGQRGPRDAREVLLRALEGGLRGDAADDRGDDGGVVRTVVAADVAQPLLHPCTVLGRGECGERPRDEA